MLERGNVLNSNRILLEEKFDELSERDEGYFCSDKAVSI